MSDKMYSEANRIFKEFRKANQVHEDISRRKATRAIYRVLEQRGKGSASHALPPPTSYHPCTHLLLDDNKTYSIEYINHVFGVIRYLRGYYVGAKNEI